MAVENLIKKLIEEETKIFEEHGLIFYPEVIVEAWNPYSSSPNPLKKCFLLQNACLRLKPDGQIVLEKAEKSYYLPKNLAKNLAKQLDIPFHYIEQTDIYDTYLEKVMHQQPVKIPEDITVHGALIPYGASPLESLIITAIVKFGKGKASKEKIIDYLTLSPPDGGGWFKRTSTLILKVEQALTRMVSRGDLTYHPETEQYEAIKKPSTTPL